jgi:RNA polymerase sigma-32 factor
MTNKDDLIVFSMPLVKKLARNYRWFNVPEDDLIQAGYLGLCKAAKRYNSTFHVKFTTYAYKYIRSEMAELALRSKCIVKIATTKPQRKLLFNSKMLMTDRALDAFEIDDICTKLHVRPTDVLEMEKRLKTGHVVDFDDVHFVASLNARLDQNNPAFTIISDDMTRNLHNKLNMLPPTHATILYERWLKYPRTKLKHLAHRFEVTPERIRQLDEAGRVMLMELMKDDH